MMIELVLFFTKISAWFHVGHVVRRYRTEQLASPYQNQNKNKDARRMRRTICTTWQVPRVDTKYTMHNDTYTFE